MKVALMPTRKLCKTGAGPFVKRRGSSAARKWTGDPLEVDAPGDLPIALTERMVMRVALVALEAGARFQREGVFGIDAMTWLCSPARRFGGLAPIEVCMERDHCLRAVLFHGLTEGLD